METIDRPFEGINVVDVTEGAQGPFAASVLADLGACVVKVERPSGEMMRRSFSRPLKRGSPLVVLSLDRGRHASIVLDLRSKEDKEELLGLVRGAHVFIENWKPGTADQFGLSYEHLVKHNTHLIYLSASGYGSDGPFSHLGSLGNIAGASGGLSSVSGNPAQLPENPRFALLDLISAMVTGEMAVAAIVLYPHGVHAETSQLESAIAAVSPVLAAVDMQIDRFGGGPCGPSDRWVVPSSMFPCSDNGYIAIHAETVDQWCALRSELGIEDLPEWRTADGRRQAAAAVEARVCESTGGWNADRLARRLRTAGVPASVVRRTVVEAMRERKLSDEHVVSRYAGDDIGWIAMAQAPWRFSASDVRASWPCPPLGTAVAAEWRREWEKNAETFRHSSSSANESVLTSSGVDMTSI